MPSGRDALALDRTSIDTRSEGNTGHIDEATQQKIRSGNFTVTTELTPPKGIDLAYPLRQGGHAQGLVDAINITESPRPHGAEPKSVGHLLDRGIEAIVQSRRATAIVAIQATSRARHLLVSPISSSRGATIQ